MDDNRKKVLLKVRREKEKKRKAEHHQKADKMVTAESVSPVTVYKLSSTMNRAFAKVKKQPPTREWNTIKKSSL